MVNVILCRQPVFLEIFRDIVCWSINAFYQIVLYYYQLFKFRYKPFFIRPTILALSCLTFRRVVLSELFVRNLIAFVSLPSVANHFFEAF